MTEPERIHEFVSLDGELIPASAAAIPIASASSLIGKGVFTTAAVFGGEIFQLERHLERLSRHAAAIGIASSEFSTDRIAEDARALIGANGVGTGKLRINILDTGPPRNWGGTTESIPRSLILSADMPRSGGPLKLCVSTYQVNSGSPLSGVKSCNYLEPLLAHQDARGRGFDEALRANEKGGVVSACLGNVFWRSRADGAWKTPPLSSGCLAGTTRAYVLDHADVLEQPASLEELVSDAEEMFITSAVKGIAPVSFLEGAGPMSQSEPLIRSLHEKYHQERGGTASSE